MSRATHACVDAAQNLSVDHWVLTTDHIKRVHEFGVLDTNQTKAGGYQSWNPVTKRLFGEASLGSPWGKVTAFLTSHRVLRGRPNTGEQPYPCSYLLSIKPLYGWKVSTAVFIMKLFYRCSWQKRPTTTQVDHKTCGRGFGDPRDWYTINKCLNTGGVRGISSGSYQLDSESLCHSEKGWRGTGWRQGGKEGGDKGKTTVVYKYARRNLSQGFVLLHNREYNQWRGLREKTRTECV